MSKVTACDIQAFDVIQLDRQIEVISVQKKRGMIILTGRDCHSYRIEQFRFGENRVVEKVSA